MQKSLIRTQALCHVCLFAYQGRTNMESVCQTLRHFTRPEVTPLHGVSVPVRDQEGEPPSLASSEK